MVYRHKMRNGKYKNFRSKDAFESWKRGMFGNMQHSGKVRFVSREELARKKEAYQKKSIDREVDRSRKSQIVSGRVKLHSSQTNITKKSGEKRAKGFRTHATSTDRFEITETEEAGKYTPLNTELKIMEEGDNIIITRISKKDGRIISTTTLRATSPEGIHNFFVELEEKFSDNEHLKLWEARALADHFNVKSGHITLDELKDRLQLHMEGNLDPKLYTREQKPHVGTDITDEELAEQGIQPIETPSELGLITEEEAKPKKSISDDIHDSAQLRQSDSMIEKSLNEPSMMELVAAEPDTIIEDTMDDKTLNDPTEEKGLFDEALETDKPLIDTSKIPRKFRKKQSVDTHTTFDDKDNDQRVDLTDQMERNQTKHYTDKEGNRFSFWKDNKGEVKLVGILSLAREDISGEFNKDQVIKRLNIAGDFEIDYEELKD